MPDAPSQPMRYLLVLVGCLQVELICSMSKLKLLPIFFFSLVYVCAFSQNLLMGGVIFGWAAISNTMLISDTGAPGLNASHIHQMFIMGT
jgi:hypothetical protein